MQNGYNSSRRITPAIILGALAGGVVLALAARMVPEIMSRVKSGMMQNMMSRMKECGCPPSDI
jgi:hypothetical protein